TKVEDSVDPTVGFVITVKPGDKVLAGEPIASVFAKDAADVQLAFEALERAITIGDRLTERPLPIVSHRVSKEGVTHLGAAERTRAGTWYADSFADLQERPVVYFCAEFGLHNSVPIYSGGLGVLAGDHCKASSDLGVPLVGVGLLYTRGYFDQRLRLDGWQGD